MREGDAVAAHRAQVSAELGHWAAAARDLADLELVASPDAWAALETYLGARVRGHLADLARQVTSRAERLARRLATAATPDDLVRVRGELERLRRDFVRAETVVDFFGDAVASRTTPRLGAVLRGLDVLAVDAMARVLDPRGIPTPPVLTYSDRGLGASILRSGVRLFDASVSPAAMIKVTRHHLLRRPTSLLHECGHQVAHLIGWNAELGAALADVLAPVSPLAARVWQGWASEVAADVYAFVLLGYAPLPALANVVDGTTEAVYRMPFADPHPFGMVRVAFNAALCRVWYGAGPWDDLVAVWLDRHPVEQAPPEAAAVMRVSSPVLEALAETCTMRPMRAFGGRALAELADPAAVSPDALRAFAAHAGRTLHTSTYLARREPMRILAATVLRSFDETAGAHTTDDLETWLARLSGDRAVQAA